MAEKKGWVYLSNRVIGPLLWWEISLVKTKQRNLLVFSSSRGWVTYKEWMKTKEGGAGEKPLPPFGLSVTTRKLFFFLNREMFRNHH